MTPAFSPTLTPRGPAALLLLARLDSRRLPRKQLADLGGRPVIGRTIDRLRRCGVVDAIAVATSDRPVDDALEDLAAQEGVGCFRGDGADVAGRCLAAMQALDLDWFIRICGDSPFADPAIVDAVAQTFLSDPEIDIATNVFPRGYPIGASAEAVSRQAMARICEQTDDLAWLEHVTAWAYEHPERFRIANVHPGDARYEGVSVAIDTPEDLERARRAVAALPDPSAATLDQVTAAYAHRSG